MLKQAENKNNDKIGRKEPYDAYQNSIHNIHYIPLILFPRDFPLASKLLAKPLVKTPVENPAFKVLLH